MADNPSKSNRPKARLPRGLLDRGPVEIAATRRMIETIRAVYERYGFEPVETPAIEFTDALGKFLPDQDRPNEGVFSFQDDDEQWLSLRYDLTAPLARYVATIQSQRGDYNGRVLSIRQEDLRSLAVIYDKSPADLTEELIGWGVLDSEARSAVEAF